MKHEFYQASQLLFSLEAAREYDTATPYRYAVSRFVQIATLLRLGIPIVIISEGTHDQPSTLTTIDQLWAWLSVHFSGFEHHVP